MAERPQVDPAIEAEYRQALVEGHGLSRVFSRVVARLPSDPRCKVCHAPFGSLGGKVFGVLGFKPSRKNPKICGFCLDKLPPGGAEVDIAVLFADVRGSTTIAETMSPQAYASLLADFYDIATDVLIRHDAIIDKLIGDEVMALFIPGICGPDYRRTAGEAAIDLLRTLHRRQGERALPVGAAVHAGLAFVGNLGGSGLVDFTAIGDAVNTAARLQSHAAPGEVVLSDPVFALLADRYPAAERRELELRGRQEHVVAYTVRPTA